MHFGSIQKIRVQVLSWRKRFITGRTGEFAKVRSNVEMIYANKYIFFADKQVQVK